MRGYVAQDVEEYGEGFRTGLLQSIPPYILYTKDYTSDFRQGYVDAKEDKGRKEYINVEETKQQAKELLAHLAAEEKAKLAE